MTANRGTARMMGGKGGVGWVFRVLLAVLSGSCAGQVVGLRMYIGITDWHSRFSPIGGYSFHASRFQPKDERIWRRLCLPMNYPSRQRPPYFDWRLDRWKIGLALLVWLGLILFPPVQSVRPDPQGASIIARPGQRPVVGASSRSEPMSAVTEPAVSPSSTAEEQAGDTGGGAEHGEVPASAHLTMAILEPGNGPLANSTPLFYGQTKVNGLVEILLAGRRYAALADGNGYWQFAPAAPLPVGMTWVQVRGVETDGTVLSGPVSRMARVGIDAQPVSAPGILSPLSFSTPLDRKSVV